MTLVDAPYKIDRRLANPLYKNDLIQQPTPQPTLTSTAPPASASVPALAQVFTPTLSEIPEAAFSLPEAPDASTSEPTARIFNDQLMKTYMLKSIHGMSQLIAGLQRKLDHNRSLLQVLEERMQQQQQQQYQPPPSSN